MSAIATATAQALMHFLWQGALVGSPPGASCRSWRRRNPPRATPWPPRRSCSWRRFPSRPFSSWRVRLLLRPRFPRDRRGCPPRVGVFAFRRRSGNPDLRRLAAAVDLRPLARGGRGDLPRSAGWPGPVRRLSRQGRPAGEETQALARELGRRLGIRRAVTLLESAAVAVPAVVGWLRPVVLVPASTLAGLAPRQLEAILAHELAHVRRHDYLVNLSRRGGDPALLPSGRLVGVGSMRHERELCCDDLAVAVCGDRLGYARALVELEGLRGAAPRLALAASGGSLASRVRRLMSAPERSSRRPWAAGSSPWRSCRPARRSRSPAPAPRRGRAITARHPSRRGPGRRSAKATTYG